MTKLVSIRDQDTQDPILTIDATLSETHQGDVEVTDHPVEQGVNISDHLRPKPRTLTLTGFVSNAPLVDGSLGQQFFPDKPGPADSAFDLLEARRIAGKLHTVDTKLHFYSNMALVSVSEPRTAQTGDALEFTLTFKEIRVVQNLTVSVQTQGAGQQPKKPQAKRTPAPAAPAADDNQSALLLINNAAKNKTGIGF